MTYKDFLQKIQKLSTPYSIFRYIPDPEKMEFLKKGRVASLTKKLSPGYYDND